VPWNSSWDAEVQSEVDDALIANGLDHLVFTSVVGADVADNSIVARLVSKSATADWDSYTNTTDSLEALRDRGDAAWITATGFSTHSAADVWAVATRVLTAGTNIVLAKGTGVTGFTDLSAAQVNTEVDTALADVGLTTTITGRIDAAVSTRSTVTTAQVNTEVDTALADIGLDHLLAAAVVGADVTDNSIVAKLASKSATADWDSYTNTTDALEAIRDRGDAAWTTATGLAAAVFDNAEIAPARVIRLGTRDDGTTVGEKPVRMRVGETLKVWLDMTALSGPGVWVNDADNAESSDASELAVNSTVGLNREMVVLELDSTNAVVGESYTVTVDVVPDGTQEVKAKITVEIPSDG
jgi:hypothetical protein